MEKFIFTGIAFFTAAAFLGVAVSSFLKAKDDGLFETNKERNLLGEAIRAMVTWGIIYLLYVSTVCYGGYLSLLDVLWTIIAGIYTGYCLWSISKKGYELALFFGLIPLVFTAGVMLAQTWLIVSALVLSVIGVFLIWVTFKFWAWVFNH